MKKLIVSLGLILVLTAVVLILMNNRALMKAESQSFTLQNYPVSVITVTRQQVDLNISQVGVIAGDHDVSVVSETQGKIIAVMVKVGSYVSAGTPLVQVDNEIPRSRFYAAQINYEKAQKDLERLQTLYKQEIISKTQVESGELAVKAAQAEYIAAKRQLSNSYITSPISGIVTARPVDYGTVVAPGTTIVDVVDISHLKVKLNLAEEDAFKIQVGDIVEITTDVYPNVKFSGRIENINAKGDEAHTYPVEVALANSSQNPLKAGMFARVSFTTKNNGKVLLIPREALVGSIQHAQVFVVQNRKALLRNITVGQEIGTNLVVLNGLKENEVIVTGGQNNLQDNTPVTVQK